MIKDIKLPKARSNSRADNRFLAGGFEGKSNRIILSIPSAFRYRTVGARSER